MKIRFAKGAFRIGRKPRPKEQPLTELQAKRVQQLVSSLTAPKPTAKPKPAAKLSESPTRKPSTGRVLVGKDLDNVIGQGIVEFAAMLKHGRFAPGTAVRSLVR